jgi:deoxyribodipyrimidine photo-lyase
MSERLAGDPRVTVRHAGPSDPDGTCVVYWMQRAQRAVDNPALDLAIDLGNELGKPVVAFFGLHSAVAGANLRHYQFLVEGLADIAEGLRRRRVGFVLRRHPHHRLLPFLDDVRPALIVGDENPLRQMEGWRRTVASRIAVPLWTVDADVIVPTALLRKEHYAARTIRPRLHERLDECLTPARDTLAARHPWSCPDTLATLDPRDDLLKGLPIDRRVGSAAGFRGGTAEARRRLQRFVRLHLGPYDRQRNQPQIDATSTLSPYLHFGHIGPREVALTIRSADAPEASVAAFLEQLIVRRELAINYVAYNERYDTLSGCEPWARQTLERHRFDQRPALYAEAQLEAAETDDPLWNAAQRQMVSTGWMHGYMRMYWAKRLLEWTASAGEAFDIAVRLNDRYELDGRDPNGYASIAWAIGGKHDRPWPTRPVFGSVRSMTAASTSRKFDARRYIERFGACGD